jgi:cellulose biosynthesis protein BcsQ
LLPKGRTLYDSLLAEAKETNDCPIQSVIIQTWYNPESKGFIDPNQRVDPDDETSPTLLETLRARGVQLVKGPYLAPMSSASVRADLELQGAAPLSWMHALSDALQPVMHLFDYIIIDTNPLAASLVGLAFCTGHYFYLPITPEQMSVDGMLQLFKTVRLAKRSTNPGLQLAGILFTRVANYKVYQLMMDNLRLDLAQSVAAKYPDLQIDISIFKTAIAQCKDGVEAATDRAVAVLHRPSSQHAMSYWFFLAELLERVGGPALAMMPEVLRGIREHEEHQLEAARQRKEAREERAAYSHDG